MSTCSGYGTARGVRTQQVTVVSCHAASQPYCPAAISAVSIRSHKLAAPCHHPASAATKSEPQLRTSFVVSASRGGESRSAAAEHTSTAQRWDREPSDGDRRGDRRGGRGSGRGGGRGGGGGYRRGEWEQWEGRRERRTDSSEVDGRRGGGDERGAPYGTAAPRRARDSHSAPYYRTSPRATLNRYLKEVQSCQELAQLLRDQPQEALTAHNIASAWARLGNLQSKGLRGRAAAAAAATAAAPAPGGGGGGRAAAGEAEEGTGSPCTTVVRQLLDPTAAAAPEMDLRQIANTLWGMAKVGDRAFDVSRVSGPRDGSGPDPTLLELQRRAVEQLQLLAAPPEQRRQQQQQPSGGGAGGQRLDVRDATQIWYGMAGLGYTWSETLKDALAEATIGAMEAALAAPPAEGASGAPRRDGGGSGDGGGGGHSSGWSESPSAVAQMVFRMATVSKGMSAGHKARLAAVVDALSYNGADDDDDAPSHLSYRSSAPLDNPDCLLVGAQLLRLDLPPGAVRRLHDMALALPPPAAARTGRTAMARALKSATSMGLQPSASEARRWQQRLLGELGGERWTSEELSWTMLALSYVKAYLPDAEARDELMGALRRLVRQLRANDATRIQAAMGTWGLRLPEREAALLRQKANGESWDEPRGEGRGSGGGGGGGGRGGEAASRSWGFGR